MSGRNGTCLGYFGRGGRGRYTIRKVDLAGGNPVSVGQVNVRLFSKSSVNLIVFDISLDLAVAASSSEILRMYD